MVSFMDDIRVMGHSIKNCWQCSRRLASIIQYLGNQDAARKRTPPSLNAGAWAGCVAKTEGSVTKTITQEKWNKAKNYLAELRSYIGNKDHPGPISHKFLEWMRGYFNHIALTYDIIIPSMRGLHNIIDSWQSN